MTTLIVADSTRRDCNPGMHEDNVIGDYYILIPAMPALSVRDVNIGTRALHVLARDNDN